MIAPCGRYTNDRRGDTLAAVLFCAVSAGTMQSSNGTPSVAPAARKKLRRERYFFATHMASKLSRSLPQRFLSKLLQSVFCFRFLDPVGFPDIDLLHVEITKNSMKERVGKKI